MYLVTAFTYRNKLNQACKHRKDLSVNRMKNQANSNSTPMKIQEQINYIKAHRRFRLDFLDIISMVLCLFGLIVFDCAFYYLFKQVDMPLWIFVIIESLFIFCTILFPLRFIDSLSFQEINTQLPFESNKSIMIAYLQIKGLEIIYAPDDDALLMAHMISFGFTIKQKEMTLVCMDDLVLMNIRPVVGKDIFSYRKEHNRYMTEIEAFIKHRHSVVRG